MAKLIPSFEINHDLLKPWLYVSIQRQPRKQYPEVILTTFDLRFKTPNKERLSIESSHTIEHLGATYLRTCLPEDSQWKDKLTYFGPMWCLTGMYAEFAGQYTSKEILPLIRDMLTYIIEFEGEVPGTSSSKECGTYKLHNLAEAKKDAKAYLEALENPILDYPA